MSLYVLLPEETCGRDLVAFPDIRTPERIFDCMVIERYVDSSICRYWSIGNPNLFLDTLRKPFYVFVTSLMRFCQMAGNENITLVCWHIWLLFINCLLCTGSNKGMIIKCKNNNVQGINRDMF